MDKITRVDPEALTKASPKSDQRLDISGVLIPFGLVLCKATLTRMAADAVLEIRLQDRDTFQDLLMIFDRSGDQLLAWEQQDDNYYLWVRKSPG
jgi:TusA-related sulfurtransferase